MDKLVKEREANIKAPKTVKEYLEQKNTVYENKGPTYLSSPISKKDGTKDKDLEDGMGGFLVTEMLRDVLKWGNQK